MSFELLLNPEGRIVNSHARGMSDDGSVIVGQIETADGTEAFRWTSGGGMVGLGQIPGGLTYSIATDVSSDGSVVVGAVGTENGIEAFRWTDGGGMVALGDLAGVPVGSYSSYAIAISGDGSIIVGTCARDGSGPLSVGNGDAFRWTSGDGITILTGLGGAYKSSAADISSDGSTIVGRAYNASGLEAYRWTSGGSLVALGELPSGKGSAHAVSADGSVIVGNSQIAYERSNNGTEAFRWMSGGGVVGLGRLDWLPYWSCSLDLSSDGSVVIGIYHVPNWSTKSRRHQGSNRIEGFIWDAVNGTRDLKGVLTGLGNNVSEYYRWFNATAISADGNVITGVAEGRAFRSTLS